MTQTSKRNTLLFLIASLVSLILLSGSLSNLQLGAGTPFPGGVSSGNDIMAPARLTQVGSSSFTLLKGILALIFLILTIYVPARLMVLVNTKRILGLISFMIPLLLLIVMISHIEPGQPTRLPSESSGIATPSSFSYPVSPLGEPPQGLIHLVLIAFLLVAGLLALKVLKRWLYPSKIKEQLLHEAETAVAAIKTGGDLRNVIIRCYVQMNRALLEQLRIERGYSMTAREFEDWLEFKGFPVVPVHQLTQLFEKVRYGAYLTMKADEGIAVESLNEIIQFCRRESE